MDDIVLVVFVFVINSTKDAAVIATYRRNVSESPGAPEMIHKTEMRARTGVAFNWFKHESPMSDGDSPAYLSGPSLPKVLELKRSPRRLQRCLAREHAAQIG